MKFSKKQLMYIIPILTMALVSAGVVTYISNTASIDVEIKSPMAMKFDGDAYGDVAVKDFGTVYGGETITYKAHSKNLANVEISSYPITTLISNEDWTGQEFTNATFEDANGGPYQVLELLYVIQTDETLKKFTDGGWAVADLKELKLFFDNDGDGIVQRYSYGSGVESWNEIKTTFSQGISSGNYSIKLCHLDDLAGNCQ